MFLSQPLSKKNSRPYFKGESDPVDSAFESCEQVFQSNSQKTNTTKGQSTNSVLRKSSLIFSCQKMRHFVAHYPWSQLQIGHIIVTVSALGCPKVSWGDLYCHRQTSLPIWPVFFHLFRSIFFLYHNPFCPTMSCVPGAETTVTVSISHMAPAHRGVEAKWSWLCLP